MEDIDAEIAGASKEQTYFNILLVNYIRTIHETLEALDRTPTENLPKVGWDQVVTRCEKLCTEATRVGLLWTGGPSEVQRLGDHITEFFAILQGLLLLAHGATVGAGRTLSTFIQTSVKQVVEVSVKLMKEAVLSYDTREERAEDVLPKAIAEVWKSWDALKKTPSNNITAIGRAVTHVTLSIKDSLCEMKELKASFDSSDKDKAKASAEAESSKKEASGDVGGSKKELTESSFKGSGNAGWSTKKIKEASADLPVEVKDGASGEAAGSSKHTIDSDVDDVSPEEIRIAGYITDVTSGAHDMLNELIRAIMRLLKKEREGALADSVGSLEKICELSELIETQIKELGSCITPPQEISAIKLALTKISNAASIIMMIVHQIEGSSREFIGTGTDLKNLIRRAASELPSSGAELSDGMGKLHL